VNQSATNAVMWNLNREHPHKNLWRVWEDCSLANLEFFQKEARAWLSDIQLDEVNWIDVYRHFLGEAGRQIEEHNQSIVEREPNEDTATFLRRAIAARGNEETEVTTEYNWAEYGKCEKCDVEIGEQCVNKRTGEPAKNPHPGRKKVVGAELSAQTVQVHGKLISTAFLGGYETFKATCTCGNLDGSNMTTRLAAEREYDRHVEDAMVSA
jgi:RNA polymerase-binding transcription factor DksA